MLIFEERPSDSLFVERVWRCHSEGSGSLLSIAESRGELVVTKLRGKLSLTVRGPETHATRLGECPVDGEWLGIRLALGVSLRSLPAHVLVDSAAILPEATRATFLLDGSAWQYPTFENADTFVAWLARAGLLVREPLVEHAVHSAPHDLTLRSVQRRFLRATGVTQTTARQIERARYATLLLRQGAAIADVMWCAGYYDQPHLTHALRRYIGQTPAQIMRGGGEQLSFLYKTSLFPSR